jgi:DNA-binding transcriptional regulator GbsR (MarR family)
VLKKKVELTDEQAKKVEELRKTIVDKLETLAQDPAVKAAQEEFAKAKEAGDKEAMKAASAKLKDAMKGWNSYEEWMKGLAGILSPEQMEKIKPKKESVKAEKPAKEKHEKPAEGGQQ